MIIETKLSHPTFIDIFAGDHAETQGTGKGKGPSGPHQWCETAGGSILEYILPILGCIRFRIMLYCVLNVVKEF